MRSRTWEPVECERCLFTLLSPLCFSVVLTWGGGVRQGRQGHKTTVYPQQKWNAKETQNVNKKEEFTYVELFKSQT